MAYNATGAAQYADAQAHAHSTGNCARYVRLAIARGGISLTPTHHAKDLGRSLAAAGFQSVAGSAYRIGDVAVIQPIPGHADGHAAIFDGVKWVSDFKQRPGPNGFYPGPEYRHLKPSYTIYRHN
ncbi:CHAP domain-containing protein [Paraburkholderia ferrariae]|uniref:CHAP domain-containing protein n=1 Tax=Paraburkholderia ferrariae TaxID=386056 RepID=UPI000A00EAF2|nr:CHAP domain-containing protein [Paraburkholderia ferrariae]